MNISSVMNYTVRQFVNDFLQDYGYFNYNTICNYCNDFGLEEDDGGYYIDFYSLPFWIYYGASKICLIFNNKKTVVKIPIESDYRFYKDKTKFFREKVKSGQYSNFDNIENLCEVETNIYSLAKEEGLSDLFAAEEKLMTYHGVPIYLQEKIQVYCNTSDFIIDYDSDLEEEINNLLDENYDYLDEDHSLIIEQFTENVAFVESLYKEIGRARFIQFLDFLVDNYINDLHGGNIGFDENGKLKLMDYSGFNRK